VGKDRSVKTLLGFFRGFGEVLPILRTENRPS
jgi:hypothetical protein